MSAGLKYTLIVTHPDTGMPVALLAGKPVPEWAAELVQPDDYVDGGSVDGGHTKAPTNAELEEQIAERNKGRAEADLIVPASTKKADLVAALEADNAKAAAGGAAGGDAA